MHSYGLERRSRVAMLLGIASVALALFWGRLQVMLGLAIPWWLDSPSIFGFYGLIMWVLDRWMWRIPAISRALSVPDLQGTWVGSARSSHDEFASAHNIRVVIRQTWTGILVVLEANGSTSRSFAAQVSDGTGSEAYQVSYQYMNHPKADAPSAMQPHKGSAVLYLSADGQRLEGEYYTGRGRTSFGTLALTRAGASKNHGRQVVKELPAPFPEAKGASEQVIEPQPETVRRK